MSDAADELFPSDPEGLDGASETPPRNRRRHAPPRRGAEPGSARRRRPRRRAAAGGGRGRLGQDPGAHPPHRPPDRRPGVQPVRDPRHHLHQQGRRRDASTGRRAGRAGGAARCGCSTFHSACVRILRRDADRPRLPVVVHASTTRPTPSGSPATSSATSASTRSGSRRGACTPPSARPRTTCVGPRATPPAGRQHLRAQDRRRLPRVPGPPASRPGPWTSTTCSPTTVAPVPHVPRRARRTTRSASSTSSSTSTRTPTGPRTSSSSCSPASHRNVTRRGRQRPVPAAGHARSHTPDGPRPIESLAVGDASIGTGGRREAGVRRGGGRAPGRYTGAVVTGRGRRAHADAPRRTTSSRRASPLEPGRHVRLPDVARRPRLPHRPDA